MMTTTTDKDPSPVNLQDLLENQTDDIAVLSQLFKEQHEEHIRQQQDTRSDELTRQVNDRLLIRHANQNQVDESLTSLRVQISLLEQQQQQETENSNNSGAHCGRWRCSVMSCRIEQSHHDYTQPFQDGNRHIFFWDCCLSDAENSKKCDMDLFDFDD